jgi:peptidyl-prolyl cis-trans isomerase D
MSIITQIRNKAGLMVILIGLALVSFLLMDVFSQNSLFNQSNSNVIGEIDGEEITAPMFEERVAEAVENYKANSKTDKVDEATLSSLRDQVWNEMVRERIMKNAASDLGLAVSREELFDMVQGSQIHPTVKQAFTDPNTGNFDRSQVLKFLREIDQQPEEMQNKWKAFEKYLVSDRENEKYNTLITKGLYVTNFSAQSYMKQVFETASGRFLRVDYSTIADSSIEAPEEDLRKWYLEHAWEFKSKEVQRNLDYVVFEVKPSTEDRDALLKKMNEIRVSWLSSDDDSMFVVMNSEQPGDDRFYAQTELTDETRSRLFGDTIGALSEVYQDGNMFKLTRLARRMVRPDSVKARHILVKVKDTETEETAKKRADSLLQLVKNGGNFAALAQANSEDPGSGMNGGDLGFFAEGAMVKPFNDACFEGKKGDQVLVKSDFGFHIIEIMDQKGGRTMARFATVSYELSAGTETYRVAYDSASAFVSRVKDKESFEQEAKKSGIEKRSVEGLKTTDRGLAGLENTREVVRWAFRSEDGAVSPVFESQQQFVVAILTVSIPKGIKPFEAVRTVVESRYKRDKKAEQISAKLEETRKKEGNSVERMAIGMGTVAQTFASVNFGSGFLNNIGMEPQVSGFIFGGKKGTLSKPIHGNNGVFVVVVDSVTPMPKEAEQGPTHGNLRNQLKSRVAGEGLSARKELISIKDERHLFY